MKMEQIMEIMHRVVAKSTCTGSVHAAYGPRAGSLVAKSAVAEMEYVLELLTEKVST
ncbi:MAG: hypothetical protein ACXVPK_03575 [Tumebacillaceae bacterium]